MSVKTKSKPKSKSKYSSIMVTKELKTRWESLKQKMESDADTSVSDSIILGNLLKSVGF